MEEAEYSISIIDVDAIETRLEWKKKNPKYIFRWCDHNIIWLYGKLLYAKHKIFSDE